MKQTKEPMPVTVPEMRADAHGGASLKRKKIGRTVGIALAAIVILVALSAIGYGLVRNPDITAALRDISIIVLALVTGIIGLFLVILIFQLQSLIALLRDEVKPILESANRTASTVRGTTTFLSDAVISPMITVASYVSAVGQAFRVLRSTASAVTRSKRKGTGKHTSPHKAAVRSAEQGEDQST